MRTAPFVLAAVLGVMACGPASAIEYPWCAEYGGGRAGSTNCGFSNIEQCRAAISGNGGFCRLNLFYRGPVAELAAPAPAPGRHSRRSER